MGHNRHESEFTCRSDAAWKKEINASGLVWSFYDTSGERFNSHSETIAFMISSLVAEGLAISAEMEHVIALQLRIVVFKSDSLQLVSAIVDDSSFSEIHGILSDLIFAIYLYLLSLCPFGLVSENTLCWG